jgi:UDP-N-acetylglucosamine diphosphorylase/glucosamine-1-phosphate N-acetyltransferase
MHIHFFETAAMAEKLHPLTHMRPIIDLRLASLTLFERWRKRLTNASFSLHTRPYLQKHAETHLALQQPVTDDMVIWLNSTYLPTRELCKKLTELQPGEALFNKNDLVALSASCNEEDIYNAAQACRKVEEMSTPETIEYPWDLLTSQNEWLWQDSKSEMEKDRMHSKQDGLYLRNERDIFIHPQACIDAPVAINAEKGPVIIAEGAHIQAFSYIEGPAFVGHKSVLKSHTRLLGSVIGPICKVAGEISASTFHSYANKQHEGFLGNSYLCPWVNLGAGTNNSNLKNNYLEVKVPINGVDVPTGLQFAGLFAGDHAKSAINTAFNTGTSLGCFTNVYGDGFPPKFIPNFAWGNKTPFLVYNLSKAKQTARLVKKRRQCQIDTIEEAVINTLFEETAPKGERKRR